MTISAKSSETWRTPGTMRCGTLCRPGSAGRHTAGKGFGCLRTFLTPSAVDSWAGKLEPGLGNKRTTLAQYVLWPMPSAMNVPQTPEGWDIRRIRKMAEGISLQRSLGVEVKRALWPIPRALDGEMKWGSVESMEASGYSQMLNSVVHLGKRAGKSPAYPGFDLDILGGPPIPRISRLGWPIPRSMDSLDPSGKLQRTDLECLGNTMASMGNRGDVGELNPDWVEWLMGWPIGWTDLRPLEMGRWRSWLRSHFSGLLAGRGLIW